MSSDLPGAIDNSRDSVKNVGQVLDTQSRQASRWAGRAQCRNRTGMRHDIDAVNAGQDNGQWPAMAARKGIDQWGSGPCCDAGSI